MEKYLRILRKTSLFSGIADTELLKMLVCLGAKIKSFDKRETVFAEGTPAKYIGIVLLGSVQMIQIDYSGNRSILSEAGPSEVVAEAFACAEIPSIPVSVIASEPCEIMLLECSRVLYTCSNVCGFHRQLIYNLMKNLASKTLSYHDRIEVTSKRTTREKLMTYLTLEARRAGARSFDIPFDRQELADYIEVDRSGLSAEISKLRRAGVIECRKNRFSLL